MIAPGEVKEPVAENRCFTGPRALSGQNSVATARNLVVGLDFPGRARQNHRLRCPKYSRAVAMASPEARGAASWSSAVIARRPKFTAGPKIRRTQARSPSLTARNPDRPESRPAPVSAGVLRYRNDRRALGGVVGRHGVNEARPCLKAGLKSAFHVKHAVIFIIVFH